MNRLFIFRSAGSGSALILFTLSLAAGSVAASTALTEGQALQLGLARPAFQELHAGRLEQAWSDVTEAAMRSNPNLEYTREENPGDATEHSIWLTQKFSLSGRRDLARQAAERHLVATGMENAAQSAERVAEIRRRFFSVLHQQTLEQKVKAWETRLTGVEAAVRKRERAGDVSGYDRLRISRERLLIQARRDRIQVEKDVARASLLALILSSDDSEAEYDELTGTMLPPEPGVLAELLARLTEHPDLARLRTNTDAHGLEIQAAEHARMPDVTLGLGAKHVASGSNEGTGLLLSASMPFPFSDQAAADRQRAAARHRVTQSEYRLALAEADGRVRGLWGKVRKSRDNARRFESEAAAASAKLVRIAEAAYHNGEIGVLELVDAYRGALEADTQALALAHEARQAAIELDLAVGPAGDMP
ncbi:TolC family protein [bacterium endosymbiont of Escarpia laminata]|nr:MAG: TolC family protein [bacterium endosymbiont of Escarpia laminata]RLJ18370.1 MAG: TolC family protein [bacterium endosymbiont of Escarpia laminata]